jgi:site-specific DNA recombinase
MSLVSSIYYSCSNRRNKGTYDNHLTVRLDRLEEAVLRGLQDRLLTPELTKEFVREYTVEINRLKAEATAHQQGAQNKLRNLSVSIDNIVDAIAVGKTSTAPLKWLDQLEGEKELLKNSMAVSAPDPVRIHPNVANIYITNVNNSGRIKR